MKYKMIYDNWISNPLLSQEAHEELSSIKDNDKEIEYRFGADLAFGTAGMRGLIGYGTNMINVYTVRRATQGLSEYIKTLGLQALSKGVVISYDTRRYSELFARTAAGVLLQNGIRVYLFEKPTPVPMLSFAVRQFKTVAGIMITASHNPKEYNGYKVYGDDGAQMSPEATAQVVKYIKGITDYFSIKEVPVKSMSASYNNLSYIGKRFEKKYIKTLCKLSLSKKAVKKCGKNIKIVYTPLHGSGYSPVMAVLKKLGINVTVVEEQVKPDPDFSTVEVPNPEDKRALKMGIDLANKINADVVFGTDPDSDRLCVAIRDDSGEFIGLTGNQVGVLLLNYVLSRLKKEDKLPKNGAVVKSFVSTGMAKSIADNYGVTLMDVPVGFKFIGEKIKQFEKDGSYEYLFGFEESCGYLRGTHSRDKDAVVASMLFAEMVCYYEYIGTNVYKQLCELYEKYGYVIDKTISKMFSGLSAMADMNAVVENLRQKHIDKIDAFNVVAVRDYKSGVRTLADGTTEKMEFSDINCLYYELENGSFVCLRPSGTEPKLKIYYSIKGNDKVHAEAALENVINAFEKIVG